MSDLMKSADEDGAFADDELKSIRSKLTNTTKMMSSKYRKRSRQLRNQTSTTPREPMNPAEGSVKSGS